MSGPPEALPRPPLPGATPRPPLPDLGDLTLEEQLSIIDDAALHESHLWALAESTHSAVRERVLLHPAVTDKVAYRALDAQPQGAALRMAQETTDQAVLRKIVKLNAFGFNESVARNPNADGASLTRLMLRDRERDGRTARSAVAGNPNVRQRDTWFLLLTDKSVHRDLARNPGLSDRMAKALVRRGDPKVIWALAGNPSASDDTIRRVVSRMQTWWPGDPTDAFETILKREHVPEDVLRSIGATLPDPQQLSGGRLKTYEALLAHSNCPPDMPLAALRRRGGLDPLAYTDSLVTSWAMASPGLRRPEARADVGDVLATLELDARKRAATSLVPAWLGVAKDNTEAISMLAESDYWTMDDDSPEVVLARSLYPNA